MIFGNLFRIVFADHLLVLFEYGSKIHLYNAAGPVFQHFLHRFQRTGGVLTVLANFLQIAFQHAQHIFCVFIILFIHVVFLVIDIGLNVFHESFRQLREVIDIVERVENTVDQALCQFTDSGHLLLTDQLVLGAMQVVKSFLQTLRLLLNLVLLFDDLCRTLLYHLLQLLLVFLQLTQSQLNQSIDASAEKQDIQADHIPLQIEGIGDSEIERYDFRLMTEAVAALDS